MDWVDSLTVRRSSALTMTTPLVEASVPGRDFSAHMAARGWLSGLQWARANGCPWDAMTCSRAAEGGHLEVLQWARANGCPEHEESQYAG